MTTLQRVSGRKTGGEGSAPLCASALSERLLAFCAMRHLGSCPSPAISHFFEEPRFLQWGAALETKVWAAGVLMALRPPWLQRLLGGRNKDTEVCTTQACHTCEHFPLCVLRQLLTSASGWPAEAPLAAQHRISPASFPCLRYACASPCQRGVQCAVASQVFTHSL